MEDDLTVPTSIKTAIIKPKIREGVYAGKLVDIKTRKADGTIIANKYGRQAILEFEIYKLNDEDNAAERITFKEGNIEHDVSLPQFINIDYNATTKEGAPILDKEGKQVVRSAFTPPGTKTSRATETFMALGWTGPDGTPFNMKAFVGKWARILVEDYTVKAADNSTTTVSTIGKVKPYNGKVPATRYMDGMEKPHIQEDIVKSAVAKSEEYLSRVALAKKQLNDDILTPRGFETLMNSLKKEYGVLD